MTDTPRATHRATQDRQRLLPAADNAFRLLGLSCHASQSEIYAAASSLRRAIKLGVVKPPAHHLAWLGSLNRTENGVRDALSRLTVPAQRIYERLFWFFDPQAAAATATGALSAASLQASIAHLRSGENACALHDIALLSLAAMLRLDPALELADDWRRTYALWKELIEGKEFWSQLMAADLKGDFEQATTFAEIGDLRGRAWRLVTAPLADVAQDAIMCEDRALARRALGVLRGSGLPQALADEHEHEILGTLEDEFEVSLHVAFSSYRHEVKSVQNVAERRETCWRAYGKFNEQVKPALKRIYELAGADSPVARRVFATAADALDELADGFETGFDNESRLKMLRRAWQLAPPDSASLLLIEEHLAEAGEAGGRQPKTDADYARQVSLALREPIAPPDLFTAYIQKEEAEKKLDRWGKGASKFIFLMMIAVFVGKCFSSLPGSRRTPLYPPVNLNVAMPRFTPMPTPEFKLSSFVDHVTVEELQAKLKAKTVTLLHVGAKGEYDTGHIPGALSMPEAELAARAKRLPKRRPVVLYCHCDEQEASARAAFDLRLLGFENVAVLEGGYRAWLDAGLPVEPPGRGLVRYGSEN
ncbi:MAG TPA: rhodanese-like domain-containing protein [Pyrinomonadaceae bacterium]|nr:rhodanese-like domain-containing protein [Pyrinomonadaceae bacterium]